MIVETEEKDVRHPQGKILLKNGNVLDCYEKGDRPVTIKPDAVGLDMTGEFLRTKDSPKKKPRSIQKETWKEMFLTPIPFENNLAYTEAKQIYQTYTLEETIAKLREA